MIFKTIQHVKSWLFSTRSFLYFSKFRVELYIKFLSNKTETISQTLINMTYLTSIWVILFKFLGPGPTVESISIQVYEIMKQDFLHA